ncbi:tensin-1 [Trichonephila clavipes]|nr:tensin-1 [Trichonephila clavipes]
MPHDTDIHSFRIKIRHLQDKTLIHLMTGHLSDDHLSSERVHQLVKEHIATNRASPHILIASSTVNGYVYSPLSFSQPTSTKSNYARDGLSSAPSYIGSSSPSSSFRMDRPVILAFPVPPGTPHQNPDQTCAILPPKSHLLSPKDCSTSPTASQTVNHDTNKHLTSNST